MGKSDNTEVSKSKAKRAQRQQEALKKKKMEQKGKIIEGIIIAVVIAIVACCIAIPVIKKAVAVKAGNDYSACLNEYGYIEGLNASDITIPDYNNAVAKLSELEYSDEKVQADIDTVLNENKTLVTDETREVVDGDEVNIDYVGKVDGKEFDGGSYEGYNLIIGSGTFIEGFEEQLIGAVPNTTFDINVTFPEDYSNEELANKDAVFTVTVNGIQEKSEFTDEFVAENLSEYASTAEEYKQYLKDTNYEKNLESWVENYLKTNTTVQNYDKKYIKNLKSCLMYEDEQSYETINQIYAAYYGVENYYDSLLSYMGMDEAEYLDDLTARAQDKYTENSIYQIICQIEGATVNADYYKSVLAAQGKDDTEYDNLVTTYGEPYVLQQAMKERAIEIVKSKVTVE